MTPKSPSSSDGSGLPPRHRPNMGSLSKDTTENDLWAFDEKESSELAAELPKLKTPEPLIPVPRETRKRETPRMDEPKPELEEERPVAKVGLNKDSIKVNVSRVKTKGQAPTSSTGHSQAGRDFDDLDSWEEEPDAASSPAPAKEEEPQVATVESVEEPPVSAEKAIGAELAGDESQDHEVPPEPVIPEKEIPEAKPTAVAAPVPAVAPLKISLGLSKLERIGLVSLLALLIVGGGIVYFYTISRLPQGNQLVKSKDFPIKGAHVSIKSASSYWRAPVTEGQNADTFRRGTQLLPVIAVEVEGGPSAIRILFRNERGDLVGDSVTRTVSKGSKQEIAATAGFDDAGMFAAYRTGQSKPWTIEVLEAPPESTQANAFKKLFEMNISSESR